ncbi:hypothetical protein ACFYPA_18300 [Streptomyces sp. NPDC005775]|uniref:hypothetical protein n=1 Tax=Streptomyces sp. NPDC005775 TaxID=3364729 RepID=UPI00368167B0
MRGPRDEGLIRATGGPGASGRALGGAYDLAFSAGKNRPGAGKEWAVRQFLTYRSETG